MLEPASRRQGSHLDGATAPRRAGGSSGGSARLRVLTALPEDLAALAKRLGLHPTEAMRGLKAVDSNGRAAGIIAYDNWTPNLVQAHMVVASPIAWRALLYPAFHYPFVACGRAVILGIVRASNARSLAMTKRLGFREVTTLRDGFSPGEDLVLFEMRREDCRWLHRKES